MDKFMKIFIPVYMIVFFLTAIVLPSYLIYRRTGINPVTFGKKADSAHDYIGNIFKLLFIIIGIYCLLNSFMEFNKIEYLNRTLFQVISLFLLVLSLMFIILSQKTMSDSWRIGIDEENRTKLVTSGDFSLVRNPIFSSMLLTLVGLFLAIPTSFMAYLLVLSCLLINIQVRLEEEYLTKIHGKDYLYYKSRVGRFMPKIMVRR